MPNVILSPEDKKFHEILVLNENDLFSTISFVKTMVGERLKTPRLRERLWYYGAACGRVGR